LGVLWRYVGYEEGGRGEGRWGWLGREVWDIAVHSTQYDHLSQVFPHTAKPSLSTQPSHPSTHSIYASSEPAHIFLPQLCLPSSPQSIFSTSNSPNYNPQSTTHLPQYIYIPDEHIHVQQTYNVNVPLPQQSGTQTRR
jgi:hypothetical protein